MRLKLVLISLVLDVSANTDKNFIIDYFRFKNAPSVIGFSCNDAMDNLELMREFTETGITAIIKKMDYRMEKRLLPDATYWKLGVYIDIRCYDKNVIQSFFSEASDYQKFDELHYWLVISSSLTDALNVIDDQAFGLSTDFVVGVPYKLDPKSYNLYDIYNMYKDRGAMINVTHLGRWDEDDYFNISLVQDKPIRRSNLHRITLGAAFFPTVYRPPDMPLHKYLDDYSTATKDSQSKFGFQILKHLSDMYNFTLVGHETAAWQPGDPVGPIVGSLVDGTADFTGSILSMTILRTYYLKYVHQDWPFKTCFIFRSPQPKNMKVQALLRPFADDVWYYTFLTMTLSIVCLAIVFCYDSIDNSFARISNAVIVVVGAFAQQGTEVQMNRTSTRIVFFMIMLFNLFVYNYYSAFIVSARFNEPILKINDSLSEFGKLKLKMASESISYLEFYLKKPDWETKTFYENYWLKLPKDKWFMEPEEGIKLVQKGGFAYHTHPDVGYPLIERYYENREICELMEVTLGRKSLTTFAVRFNSTIVEITRIGLTKIAEAGLSRRQVRRWSYRKPECRDDVYTITSINMYEFAPILILLTIGIGISMGMFVIERLVANHTDCLLFKLITTRRITNNSSTRSNSFSDYLI